MSLRFATVVVSLLASGCATVVPQVQEGDWTQRRAALQALDGWNLDGRVAIAAGDDARRFIEQNLGPESPLPIAEMRYWLVGAPAPVSPYREAVGAGGSLSGLEQSGWAVSYQRYRAVGSIALPERVEMTTEGLRLRVVISEWHLAP